MQTVRILVTCIQKQSPETSGSFSSLPVASSETCCSGSRVSGVGFGVLGTKGTSPRVVSKVPMPRQNLRVVTLGAGFTFPFSSAGQLKGRPDHVFLAIACSS